MVILLIDFDKQNSFILGIISELHEEEATAKVF